MNPLLGIDGANHPSIPIHKLAINASTHAVVLVSCGSFNPPTLMHLRMLELARQHLVLSRMVVGGYLSPVHDAYGKAQLLSASHRVEMCRLSVEDSDWLMVDSWEALEQQDYTRTVVVLQSIKDRLQKALAHINTSANIQLMLVCGADVLLTMCDPTIWQQDLLEVLLRDFGVVCITRNRSIDEKDCLQSIVGRPGTLVHRYKDNVEIVEEPIPNLISSSAVRRELAHNRSVRYLVHNQVEEYIRKHRLYENNNTSKQQLPAD